MQKLIAAIVLLAFTFTNVMAYQIRMEPERFDLNASDGYSREYRLIYIPDDQSKIPEKIRVQARGEGVSNNLLEFSNRDTVLDLPKGEELNDERTLGSFQVRANTAAIIASGVALILPISTRFEIINSLNGIGLNLEDFDEAREPFSEGEAEISLINFEGLEEIEISPEAETAYKDLKLSSLNASTLICPALEVNSEDSSKYSLVDIPQPRVHIEAAIPTEVNGQITDSVTQALVKNDIENTMFTVTKKSSSKLKNFLNKFKTKKFTLSDVNALILESSDENTKRISIDGLVNEADALNFRERGLRSLVSKDQARLALNGEDLNTEDLDTNKSKKVKVKFQAKTMGEEKGLFHKAKGDMDVIFTFDSFLPLK